MIDYGADLDIESNMGENLLGLYLDKQQVINDSIIELFLDKGFDATKLEHMQLCLIKPIMLY